MKSKGFKVLLVALVLSIFAGTTVYAARCIVKKTEPYLTLEQDVLYPANMVENKKYPVVFMCHNGYADKSAWGDYPQEIANAGFITVNITWQSWDCSNVESAVNYTLDKYKDIIDTKRVVFIGGCHGGKEIVELMDKENKNYTVKTAVVLSVSEIDDGITAALQKKHVPILAYYSKNDEYGAEIGATSKKFAEEIVTQPCRVKPQEDPAHGNNMVTTSQNKDEVRNGIIGWIKSYTK